MSSTVLESDDDIDADNALAGTSYELFVATPAQAKRYELWCDPSLRSNTKLWDVALRTDDGEQVNLTWNTRKCVPCQSLFKSTRYQRRTELTHVQSLMVVCTAARAPLLAHNDDKRSCKASSWHA